jgi:hypothetical protein
MFHTNLDFSISNFSIPNEEKEVNSLGSPTELPLILKHNRVDVENTEKVLGIKTDLCFLHFH